MKTYPSIARGIRISFYSGILMLLVSACSVVSFFFRNEETMLIPVMVLDLLACCGFTAGMVICAQADKKYIPALCFSIASAVLTVVAMVSSPVIGQFFIWLLQCGAVWLLIYSLCNQTSQLLEDRDKSCASLGNKLTLLYLIPCVIRYFTSGRAVGRQLVGGWTAIQNVPFGARLAGAAVCLVITLVIDGMLLSYLNTASALLTYQAKSN